MTGDNRFFGKNSSCRGRQLFFYFENFTSGIDPHFFLLYDTVYHCSLMKNMALQEKIKEDIKAALRKKDELRLSVLRMASAALHNKSIEKRASGGEETLTEEEIVAIMRTEVKKRRDAAREFTRGNRP